MNWHIFIETTVRCPSRTCKWGKRDCCLLTKLVKSKIMIWATISHSFLNQGNPGINSRRQDQNVVKQNQLYCVCLGMDYRWERRWLMGIKEKGCPQTRVRWALKDPQRKTAQDLDTKKSGAQNVNLDYFLNQLQSHKPSTFSLWIRDIKCIGFCKCKLDL